MAPASYRLHRFPDERTIPLKSLGRNAWAPSPSNARVRALATHGTGVDHISRFEHHA